MADIKALAASVAALGMLQNPVVEPELIRVKSCYSPEGRASGPLFRLQESEAFAVLRPLRKPGGRPLHRHLLLAKRDQSGKGLRQVNVIGVARLVRNIR